jgi:hypothetical protein
MALLKPAKKLVEVMKTLHNSILIIEKEDNSVIEIIIVLDNIVADFAERILNRFLPDLVTNELLRNTDTHALAEFTEFAIECYKNIISYINDWNYEHFYG